MRQYIANFNLRGAMQEKLVGKLSGGERGRVHLAKTLRGGCNLLLLDEPSNDLDVDTLQALEEAIGGFAGSAVIVSHDRWFLDRVCDHTLAFSADGIEFFEGSVSAYYAWCDGRISKEDALAHSAEELYGDCKEEPDDISTNIGKKASDWDSLAEMQIAVASDQNEGSYSFPTESQPHSCHPQAFGN